MLDRSARSPRRARTSTAGRIRSALDEVPEELRAGCGAVVDGGELPGVPSTVLDLTGDEPVVLREGAATWPRLSALRSTRV